MILCLQKFQGMLYSTAAELCRPKNDGSRLEKKIYILSIGMFSILTAC
jgi:hypothetical protein